MPKRGRPRSQPSQDAEKQLRLYIDDVVDDIIPVALAKKFRDRLSVGGSSTSGDDGEQTQTKGRKGDRWYCRRTPSE
ncbi:hypothetical protein SASPL_101789 [Salvia splendens]|uniref:Uncharacterized protein n=1 Tax=Salvia splendens TaxID=180675 RepID=A0A8X8YSD2_SALSN|nr:hypothetical protein SASPL_101789 [Salvia splendens]